MFRLAATGIHPEVEFVIWDSSSFGEIAVSTDFIAVCGVPYFKIRFTKAIFAPVVECLEIDAHDKISVICNLHLSISEVSTKIQLSNDVCR